MATVRPTRKACSLNPLKTSAPLGAALAYLGIEGSVPLLHGAQGCTSFGLVLAVRHFREAIPLQTTAMNEVTAILGGGENLEEALTVIRARMKPRFIGVASTALTETRAEDVEGTLRALRARRPELQDTAIVHASTPDFEGALEEGWARATAAVVEALVEPPPSPRLSSGRLVVLPGVHHTPADLEELRDLVEAFGLEPVFLPDLSRSLDGHLPPAYVGTSLGGTSLQAIASLGEAVHAVALGEQQRLPAEALARKAGVPFTVLSSVTGLGPTDALVSLLMDLSGREAPPPVRRWRSQLVDAMLDGHFALAGARVALAGDPDLLGALAHCLHGLGAEVVAAVASTGDAPGLAGLPCEEVLVGDLGDLEDAAARAGAELLVTNGHGQPAAERLGIPLYRAGFPVVDRVGTAHRRTAGYRGSRALIHEVANTLLAAREQAHPSPGAPR